MVFYSLAEAGERLQCAFNIVFKIFPDLELSLNAKKYNNKKNQQPKVMLFSKSEKLQSLPPVVTPDGSVAGVVNSFKDSGILIDGSLTFKPHIDSLVQKIHLIWNFYFRNMLFHF